MSNNGGSDAVTDAHPGACKDDCEDSGFWYIALFSLFVFVHSTSEVGSMLLILRCVHPQDKAMALGLIQFAIGLFGESVSAGADPSLMLGAGRGNPSLPPLTGPVLSRYDPASQSDRYGIWGRRGGIELVLTCYRVCANCWVSEPYRVRLFVF